jgi:hypothetical protein
VLRSASIYRISHLQRSFIAPATMDSDPYLCNLFDEEDVEMERVTSIAHAPRMAFTRQYCQHNDHQQRPHCYAYRAPTIITTLRVLISQGSRPSASVAAYDCETHEANLSAWLPVMRG